MVQQCQTNCTQKGGAIFCDGQFVNASNAQSCADELLGKLKIDVDIKASVETAGDKTENAVDKVSKKVDKACSVANPGAGGAAPLALIPFGLVFAWRMRRRR
jgi:MYXO-CTERM domain-containing protein